MIYQNLYFFFFWSNSIIFLPLNLMAKLFNDIQSNRVESKMPFTLLMLTSLLYHLPSLPKKLLKLASSGKGLIQKSTLAAIWQNQWLEYHKAGSGSTAVLDVGRSDTILLGSWLWSDFCLCRKRLVLAFQVFISMWACLCSRRTGNIPPGTYLTPVPCTHTCQ